MSDNAGTLKTHSRRAFLALAAAAGVSLTARHLLPSRPGTDPNDFPVANFGPPVPIDAGTWRLQFDGEVSNPFSLSYAELLALPRERYTFSLDCIQGWSAVRAWEGVPLARLMDMARPIATDAPIHILSTTGYATTMTSDRFRRNGALLVTHIDGVRLSHDHGFPARVMVPGVVGEENVKWIVALSAVASRPA